MLDKSKLHTAGLLIGSIVLSSVAKFAAYEGYRGLTDIQQEQEFIQLLATAVLIFITSFAVSRWKGTTAGYLAMVFMAALMILERWPRLGH